MNSLPFLPPEPPPSVCWCNICQETRCWILQLKSSRKDYSLWPLIPLGDRSWSKCFQSFHKHIRFVPVLPVDFVCGNEIFFIYLYLYFVFLWHWTGFSVRRAAAPFHRPYQGPQRKQLTSLPDPTSVWLAVCFCFSYHLCCWLNPSTQTLWRIYRRCVQKGQGQRIALQPRRARQQVCFVFVFFLPPFLQLFFFFFFFFH